MLNVPKLLEEIRYITIYPEKWGQSDWLVPDTDDGSTAIDGDPETPPACGTVGCLAGNTALHAGWKPNWEYSELLSYWYINEVVKDGLTDRVRRVAQNELQLTERQADALFAGDNSLDKIWDVATKITAGEINIWHYEDAKKERDARLKKLKDEERKKAIAELQRKVQEYELTASDLHEIIGESAPKYGSRAISMDELEPGDRLIDTAGREYTYRGSREFPESQRINLYCEESNTYSSLDNWERKFDTQLYFVDK